MATFTEELISFVQEFLMVLISNYFQLFIWIYKITPLSKKYFDSLIAHFLAQAQKNKNIQPEKSSLYFEKRNFLIFSQKKAFLIFREKKAVLIFQETETPKKFLTFFHKKAFLIFRKTEIPKKFFIL